jgi:protein-tyrosine phosphatase
VFHCAAGKDRTGMVAALLLSLLGVAEEDVGTDFALSDRALEPAASWAREHDAELAAWLDAAPPWLQRSPAARIHGFLDGLRDRHGSIEAYLLTAGLEPTSIDLLRDRLLEWARKETTGCPCTWSR